MKWTYFLLWLSFSSTHPEHNKQLILYSQFMRLSRHFYVQGYQALFFEIAGYLNNKVGNNRFLLNDVAVSRTNTYKCLGVEIDEKLSWEEHIETICNKASAGIGAIRRVKSYVPVDTLQTIYNALIQPYFDYCSSLWDNCGKLLQDK